ncbi:MAG: hypothetical protein M3120_04465 [Pseudomonadota bacterium]|nr:hypothetical protein [Pseudomonadota bacterium]
MADIIRMHKEPDGTALIAIDGRIEIAQVPIIFFAFFFATGTGNIISVLNQAGTGPATEMLPPISLVHQLKR